MNAFKKQILCVIALQNTYMSIISMTDYRNEPKF